MPINLTAVAIIAICGWVIVQIIQAAKSKPSGMGKAEKAELEQQIEQLKERVATLEKIVTDDSYELKKKFKDLEKDRVA
ncbi:hypothetical protein [Alteromonas salexigens]|uniref:hypothetical protein n=1 Tax=Alteromonas salexigens TaxID=2982530 RepID=UPI0027E4BD86|nr:hypothetical protein [Alteromonas salexigens]